MKKKVWVILFVSALFLFLPTMTYASSSQDASDLVDQVKRQLSAAFDSMDDETAKEVFSFLKEQVEEGNLNSEEGLKDAIREGEEKFGVEVSREDAENLVDTMEKLEALGFSSEYIVEKTESMYQEYGADFVDHVDEVVTGAVKNAASNVISSFFNGLKDSVKSFFNNLF